ncbi:MAG: hypothetical protein RLZZ244_2407, partial [Verrucomicrobiota bacterium]
MTPKLTDSEAPLNPASPCNPAKNPGDHRIDSRMKPFPVRPPLARPLATLLLLALPLPEIPLHAAEPLPVSSPAQSQLHWIWSPEPQSPQSPIHLEREFSLDQVPGASRVKFACSSRCELLVNGTLAASLSDPKRPMTVELGKLLRKGDNKVQLQPKPGGSEPSGVLLSLLIAENDGTRRRLETNASWKAVSTPGAAPQPAREVHPYAQSPWGDVFSSLRPSVTPASEVSVPQGFKVELLHALDEEEGSWVALCTDPKGRLIASDAGGKLVRITPPPLGGDASQTRIEPIPVELGHANGLLWAFDSLYVMVCQEGVYGTGSGVYRVRDTNGDDVLDSVELLRKVHGSGDHGPHALLLSPDGKSITVVCGNSTRLTEIQHHQVPPIWKDDLALPKITGHGFMLGAGAPAGYIARMSPDGKEWTLAASGFRNQYDAAYNRHGELFTYDADMEWDLGMPWYRPTRVCHVVDGGEFGWRSVSGKWSEDYADSLPPVLNVGRGSPTGVGFGYGAKFPAAYQNALFIADWTFGKIYAVHLKESGASYNATMEVFAEGRGTKPTDLVINPKDGALYFCGGSRRSNSALYRVTYSGPDSTAESVPPSDPAAAALRSLRHRLEDSYHASDDASLQLALDHLAHPDRFIRFAARTLLEFRTPDAWKSKALALTAPRAVVQTALALARLGVADAKADLLNRLAAIPWAKLDPATRLDVLRAVQVVSIRLGDPEGPIRETLLSQLHATLPGTDSRCNVEAGALLVRWKSPLAASKLFPLFEKAPTQEEQLSYAAALRLVPDGWPAGAREKFFRWFLREEFHKAGHLAKFIADIKKDAVASLSDSEKSALQTVLNAPPESRPAPPLASRLFVKNWNTDELAALVEPLLKSKRDPERGKELFRQTACITCHLFKNEGGA